MYKYNPLLNAVLLQDDFIDCFGNPDIIGKVGTDIQGNKCTWLIVQALKRASDEQRAILEARKISFGDLHPLLYDRLFY